MDTAKKVVYNDRGVHSTNEEPRFALARCTDHHTLNFEFRPTDKTVERRDIS
jgi:hypothetical protein